MEDTPRRTTVNLLIVTSDLFKPVAAIRHPPTDEDDRDRGHESPPERQGEIGEQAKQDKACPEDLFLHT